MTEVPDLSGPGILLAATYITDPALSDKTFNKWYNEIHIPDVIATGGISQATRFRNANPDATEKYLAIYHVPDLSIVTSEKFQKIPDKHEMLPDGRSIREVVNMEVRFYKLVQVDPESQDQDGVFPTILYAGVEPGPGAADDYDAYMREEHLAQFRPEPGWKRSRRYKLVLQVKGASNFGWGEGDATSWLALYDFDTNNKLGTTVQALDPITDWTKRIMGSSKKFEMGVFHKIYDHA